QSVWDGEPDMPEGPETAGWWLNKLEKKQEIIRQVENIHNNPNRRVFQEKLLSELAYEFEKIDREGRYKPLKRILICQRMWMPLPWQEKLQEPRKNGMRLFNNSLEDFIKRIQDTLKYQKPLLKWVWKGIYQKLLLLRQKMP
ncbi:MAG: hypothetical protein EZS28_052799, partial [Streblomastix strix]